MPVLNHVHSYVRPRGSKVYICSDPHCTHQMARHLLNGKASLCPQCGTEFTLNWELLRRATPKCKNCSTTRDAKQYQAAKSILENILGDQSDA